VSLAGTLEPARPVALGRRAALVAALAAAHVAAYEFFNHRTGGPEPVELPLTWLDTLFPLVPWTVWPYLALVVAGPVLVFWIRSERVFRRVVLAYACTMACVVACYALVPTAYPRPEPVFAEPTLSTFAWTRLTLLDTSRCAFPSGHVVAPWLAALGLAADGRGRIVLLVVALATVSLLTTKQHYGWDVAAGLALVFASWRLVRRSRFVTAGAER
jgi:membrane-associated phospholipid phosphatase